MAGAGPATQLQIIPSEVLLKPAQTATFRVRKLDANGFTVGEVKDPKSVKWSQTTFLPTARVRSTLKKVHSTTPDSGRSDDAVASGARSEATVDGLKGYIRGRVLPGFPIKQDFESFTLSEMTTKYHRTAHAICLSAVAVDWSAFQI